MKTNHPIGWLRQFLLLLGCLLFCSASTIYAQVSPAPLSITCPPDLNLWTCSSNLAWQYPQPVVAGGCLGYQVVCEPPSGSTFPIGTTTVNCRVVDNCGKVATCSFTVTVRKDTEPPKIQCPPDMTVLACPNAAGGCGTIVHYPAPVATDNSGSVAVTCTPASGSFFPCGDTVVVCVAEDRCGNKDVCRFIVSVKEGGFAPVIQCPPDQVINTCSNTAVLNYPAPLVNPPGTTVVCFPPVGTILPLGSHAVTCIASNACGTNQCSFKVVVRPIPQVGIQCPTNNLTFTIPCGSNCVPVFYPLPTVINGALESCVPPQGTCLSEGVHIIVCRATNACGAVLCEFPVRVIRGEGNPPQIRCPNDLTFTTCSNSATVFYPNPVVAPAGTVVTCVPPSGSSFPVGNTIVVCTASNACGVTECKFTVTVRRIDPPVIICPTNQITLTVPCGVDCVPIQYPLPQVLNGGLQSCTPPNGTCLPPGSYTIKCVATNGCATSTCEFTIRIVRGQGNPPVIRCPQDVTLVTCSNCVPLVFPRPEVFNGTLASCDPPPGTCLPVGVYTVKCVATNECGASTCEFRVRVIQADEVPRMTITVEHGYVIVCWTKTCKCFKLQGTRSLNRPFVWVDVQADPIDLGDRYCVRIPITLRMQYFRLAPCDQPTAVVYDVTGLPVTRAAAGHLAAALGLPADKVFFGDGSVRFLDPAKFQAIPTRPILDPALIGDLTQESENDKGELGFEAIDFAGLKELRVLGPDEAIDKFGRALKEAELLPANGDLVARHSTFEAVDDKGGPMIDEKPIDTHVNFHFELGGLPLIGPGAKLDVAFGPDGTPTALLGSFREHKPFQEIPIIDSAEAARRCRKMYPQLGANLNPHVVYYAPSLLLPAVQKIIPCYECAGEGVADGQAVNLLRTLIPATDDPAFTPSVVVDAAAQGNVVQARAAATGGTPPYTYQWSSSSVDLGGMFAPDAASIQYPAAPRDEGRVEIVHVVVTDANGVQVQGEKTVVLGPGIAGGLADVLFMPAVAGVSDYGVERGVSDLCAGQQAAFNARFSAAGYVRQFNFSGLSAWERDFKEGPTGLDYNYVDNVDLAFYMGHGYGGGFTFESNHDDGTLHYTDAVKAWGNKDLEWLALLSCSVMADTYDGKSCFARWSPTFDGLHLMMGFANTAYDSDGFAGTFADWTLGRYFIFPAVPIRSAWLLAADSNQPSSVIASVMGVIGPAGCSNYNDYYWGKGPVGPDLRGSNIRGFWRIKQ